MVGQEEPGTEPRRYVCFITVFSYFLESKLVLYLYHLEMSFTHVILSD